MQCDVDADLRHAFGHVPCFGVIAACVLHAAAAQSVLI